ncbi:MerR family DNA-binding protein, partial [Rhizobium ruizarguesonis]
QDDPHQSCASADAIAKARLIEVEQRIRSLMALKARRLISAGSKERWLPSLRLGAESRPMLS